MSMAFTRTDTQEAIADTIEGLLNDHYDFEARKAVVTGGIGHSPPFWAKLAELGLLGIEVPEAEGGIGGAFAETAVALQAFGRALVVEPFVATAVLGVGLIVELGNPDQRAALLGGVVAGTTRLAFAHDERSGDHIATIGERVTDGWRVRGAKIVVSGGNVADVLIVSASTAEGAALFLVPADSAGVDLHGYTLHDDTGAADVTLDVTLAETALLGVPGSVQPAIDRALDRGAAAAVHESVGAMERLCTMTPDYLKTRVQFGQPLARFQVLQHRMVDMAIALEEARSMAILATAALDEPDANVRARGVSAAKLFVNEAARLVGQTAVQLHGGIALTHEYPAGHYFKRLTLLARQYGDDLHHADRYAGLMA